MGLRNSGYKNNVNISPGSPILDFLKLGTGVVVILGGLFFLFGLALDFVVPRLDTETEMWLSEQLEQPVFENADRLTAQEKELQTLADSIRASCVELPYDVRVLVVKDEMVNAFAFPGGTIVVFSGLIEQMKSENELAFVLGHEMGHMANRDHLRRYGRVLFLGLLQSIVPDLFSVDMVERSLLLTDRAFTRQQELAADRYGMDVLNCRYGHVEGADDFFASMDQGRDIPIWRKYYLSHPEGYKRINAMEEYAVVSGYGHGPLTVMPEAFR